MTLCQCRGRERSFLMFFSTSFFSVRLLERIRRRRCPERNSYLSTLVICSLPRDFVGSWRTCLSTIFSLWSCVGPSSLWEIDQISFLCLLNWVLCGRVSAVAGQGPKSSSIITSSVLKQLSPGIFYCRQRGLLDSGS